MLEQIDLWLYPQSLEITVNHVSCMDHMKVGEWCNNMKPRGIVT